MKLNSNFITRTVDDTQILVPIGDSGFSGIATGNETAAFIINQLKTDTTPEAILDAMANEYDAPRAVLQADINEILNKLHRIGALDE
ncbi:MAG TPA: hypothetical protein DDY98_06480 [Ruminococcaceae bacterium]|nr:hypothetical protein [Oscillospiraceae bacterium]